MIKLRHITRLLFVSMVVLIAAFVFNSALGKPAQKVAQQPSPIHPGFILRDADGENVLESGKPLSTMKTCGGCHDTAYIASHSFHADMAASDFTGAGPLDPLTYRTALPQGDVKDWVQTNASRLVGGGPASELVEMDCLLCHVPQPNNAARIAALQAGDYQLASTATLFGSGIVENGADGLVWNTASFSSSGRISLPIQDPGNENCAQCHGSAHATSAAFVLTTADLNPQNRANWQTITTGQVVAPSKISASGMNISGKDELARAWDVHVERGVGCTDCHYSLNNPASVQSQSDLAHLIYDPRRLDIGEYLERPNHNFARGQSAQNALAPELKGTMRRCEGCHDASQSHDWLPYSQTHLQALACESCHIPELFAPAVASADWTALQADLSPLLSYRGVQGDTGSITDLVTGYQPVLLPRTNIDGKTALAPYNLVTAYYWVDANAQPVSMENLQTAYFDNGKYATEVLTAFDANGDKQLSQSELVLDSPAKQELIAQRLGNLGVQSPQIKGEVYPYSLNHNVAYGEWVTSDCKSCHNAESRITTPLLLSDTQPLGIQPAFISNTNVTFSGAITQADDGSLYYKPATSAEKLYVFGHSRVSWIDWLGLGFFIAVLGAVSVHGGLRFASAAKTRKPHNSSEKVYLYGVYERFWHWMQTFAISILLITGLIIHRPELFGYFSFRGIVAIHNTLAALLVINALLSLFYHLVSGEIRQFIPKPYGFFDQAILQTQYYLKGIFKRQPHPFEKTADRKLNPLQQLTYFGILNVLLPLQIITGGLMWGVQQWGAISNLFGGLPVLAPIHSMVAWLFASFIVAHVYLTTTGHRPLSAIQAMMSGWEEMEITE